MIEQKQKLSFLLRDYFDKKDSPRSELLREMSLGSHLGNALPVHPSNCGWEVHKSPERFSRKFSFANKHAVKNFVSECLDYEMSNLHSGTYKIDHLDVTVEVYTHDVDRITELDQEFTKQIDFIYEDVLNFGRF